MKGRAFFTLAIAWTLTLASHAEPRLDAEAQQVASILAPTNHPVLPADLSRLWLVPAKTRAASASGSTDFLAAMKVADKTDYAKALPLFTKASRAESPFGNYALYYAGMGELRLGRFAAARDLFQQLLERRPIGYLAEAAALGAAECAEGLNDYDAAVAIYERLAAAKTTAPDDLLMRLGDAAKSAGDNRKAAEAFGRVLYDFPLSSVCAIGADSVRRSAERSAADRRQPALQARARTRRALVRRAAVRRRAKGVRGAPAARLRRRSRDRRSAAGRKRLLPEACARGAGRAQAVHDQRIASRRSALLLRAGRRRSRAKQAEFRRAVRRIVDEFPTRELGRGSAQQSSDAARSRRRGRRG